MDLDKSFSFVADNITGFFEVSVSTLVRPKSYFQLVPATPKTGADTNERPWLNPRLFAFAALSVILGTLLNSLIPGRRSGPDIVTTLVLLLIYWFVYSAGLHLVCKVLRGRGSLVDTLAVSIQVLSTLFVVASIISLILVLLTRQPIATELVSKVPFVGRSLKKMPELLFFVVQALLLAIYLPLALKHVHGFGWIRQIVVGFVPLLTMWLGILIYLETGAMGALIAF